MIKFCAHLGYQFQEFPPLDRFRQAASAGFKAVEWPGIYSFDPHQLKDLLDEADLQWVQITLPMGAPGEKGLTALPGREEEFETSLQRALTYARVLGARAIHPMSGLVTDWEDSDVHRTYLRNLTLASRAASDNGLELLVEVIGEGEVPGYGMSLYARAHRVFEELGQHSPKLILDAYHAQVITGDAIGVARQWAGRVGHVQVADAPGRHEPGTGSIDFETFFSVIAEGGYDGWVGCEYRPKGLTLDGLEFLRRYGAQSH